MIVVRLTHKAKAGHKDELIALLKDWLKLLNLTGRVFTIRDNWDTVCYESEYATEEDLQEFEDNLDRNRPDIAKMLKRFQEIRGSNTIQEILIVH